MKNFIILLFLLLFLLLMCQKNNSETFADYIDKMGYNNKTIQLFCKKLGLLDEPNENNILLKKFNTEVISKKKREVEELKNEIDELLNISSQDYITKKNKYKLKTHLDATKQMELINMAKENLKNKDKIVINVK